MDQENQSPEGGHYTVERHGNGWAIYTGRDHQHHGCNWGQLTECDEALAKLIERGLNLAAIQPAPAEGGEIARLHARIVELAELVPIAEANERERCAQTCEQLSVSSRTTIVAAEHYDECAAAIRALSKPQPKGTEPIAYTVAGEITNWARDFSKYRTQHYTRPVYAQAHAPAGFVLFPAAARSDVLTAAGLVRHGKQCKALADRLGEAVATSWDAGLAVPSPAPAHDARAQQAMEEGRAMAAEAAFPVVSRWTMGAKDAGPRARVWVQFEDGGAEVEFAPAVQCAAVGGGA